jgi:hypothetical protein
MRTPVPEELPPLLLLLPPVLPPELPLLLALPLLLVVPLLVPVPLELPLEVPAPLLLVEPSSPAPPSLLDEVLLRQPASTTTSAAPQRPMRDMGLSTGAPLLSV